MYEIIIKQQEEIIRKKIKELKELEDLLKLIKSRDYEIRVKQLKKEINNENNRFTK